MNKEKLLISDNKSNNSEFKSNKQIEEMAKILCGMKNGCDGCMWDKAHCNERNCAEEIYNAGYRKQSKGEWRRAGYSLLGERAYKCSECGFAIANIDDVYMRFCPGCGAKMKGV